MRRPGRLLLIGTVMAAVAAGDGCGADDSSPETFDEDGFPFTFEYPGDFEVTDDLTLDQNLGAESDENLAVALDDDNTIILQRFSLAQEVTDENIDLAKGELDGLIDQIESGAGDGETGTIAGYPSVEYPAVTVSDELESRLIALFDGDEEFLLNCQSTEDERDTMEEACDRMLETLEPK